jgi:L-ascorbate metabolism protein UlaG (beta-lactamase superfamily)
MAIAALIVLLLPLSSTYADVGQATKAHYLANAGVMVEKGSVKVLFDPFFRNDFGVYDLVPTATEEAIFAGLPPWDGVDAIFISHHHSDHFDPALVVAFLRKWPTVEAFAPQQAVDVLLSSESAIDESVLLRIHGLDLDRGSDAATIEANGLEIEAVYVAHAGWPGRHTETDNLVFRVALDSATTVVHLGDADKNREHYEPYRDFWQARSTQLAFAPVWLFLTDPGRFILSEYVAAEHAIGVHVDNRVPDDPADRPANFNGLDIFTQPGETREFD